MSVKGGRGLFQSGDGQSFRRAQPQVVGMAADGAMSAPGGPGQALDLAMGGETTALAHKAKRRNGRQPGKPGGGIGLQSEETVPGANHYVASPDPIVDERSHRSRGPWLLGASPELR